MAGARNTNGGLNRIGDRLSDRPYWTDCDAVVNGADADIHAKEECDGSLDVAVTVHNRDAARTLEADLYSTGIQVPAAVFDADEWDLESTFNVAPGAQVTRRIAGPVMWIMLRGQSDAAAFNDMIDVYYQKTY